MVAGCRQQRITSKSTARRTAVPAGTVQCSHGSDGFRRTDGIPCRLSDLTKYVWRCCAMRPMFSRPCRAPCSPGSSMALIRHVGLGSRIIHWARLMLFLVAYRVYLGQVVGFAAWLRDAAWMSEPKLGRAAHAWAGEMVLSASAAQPLAMPTNPSTADGVVASCRIGRPFFDDSVVRGAGFAGMAFRCQELYLATDDSAVNNVSAPACPGNACSGRDILRGGRAPCDANNAGRLRGIALGDRPRGGQYAARWRQWPVSPRIAAQRTPCMRLSQYRHLLHMSNYSGR